MTEENFLLEKYEGLGTVWFIELFESIPENKRSELSDLLKKTITEFNNRYSRFKSDSHLNTLNREGELDYDEDLYNMLTIGEKIYTETRGTFDLFIKNTLEQKGYGFTTIETKRPCLKKSYDRFSLENNHIHLHTDKQIDLGGIGKGFLIDKLAKLLKREGVEYFLINGGGDIYVSSNQNKPIDIYLSNPKDSNELLGLVSLKNKSFCASSSYLRRWVKDAKEVNHFVDTKENKTIEAASFAIGDTATITDVLATIICIESDTKQLKKLAQEYNVEFLKMAENEEYIETIGFKSLKKELY